MVFLFNEINPYGFVKYAPRVKYCYAPFRFSLPHLRTVLLFFRNKKTRPEGGPIKQYKQNRKHMTKIIVLPVFMLAGFGEGTPQQDSMRAKCAAGEIWTHGRILLSAFCFRHFDFRHFECFSFIISVSQKVLTKDRSTNNQDCTNDLHRQQLFTKKNHGEQHS